MHSVIIHRNKGIAHVQLRHGKVNAIDPIMIYELMCAFQEILHNDKDKAVILGSANQTTFSAGFNLPELSKLDRGKMRTFMRLFHHCILQLFTFPKPIVCSIGGHAIAGGMVLALTADYRVVADSQIGIGLNGAKIGISIPHGVIQILLSTVTPNVAKEVVYFGKRYTPAEAKGLGIVDEVVAENVLRKRCIAIACELRDNSTESFKAGKSYLRDEISEAVRGRESESSEEFMDIWFSKETRRLVNSALLEKGARTFSNKKAVEKEGLSQLVGVTRL